MNKETKSTLIKWTKRLLGFTAMLLWGKIIFEIAQMGGSFMEQAPYCMGSTMLIFWLLTASYKGLEYWERRDA